MRIGMITDSLGELSFDDLVCMFDEPVANEAGRTDGVVVRPHRAVVVADRVVRTHVRGERPDTPPREHLG